MSQGAKVDKQEAFVFYATQIQNRWAAKQNEVYTEQRCD